MCGDDICASRPQQQGRAGGNEGSRGSPFQTQEYAHTHPEHHAVLDGLDLLLLGQLGILHRLVLTPHALHGSRTPCNISVVCDSSAALLGRWWLWHLGGLLQPLQA